MRDNRGGIVQQYKVDPWGRPRVGAGVVGADPVEAQHNRKLFTGQEYDAETGLYYYKSRYYDADSGRFVTQDSYLGEPGIAVSSFLFHLPSSGRGGRPWRHPST